MAPEDDARIGRIVSGRYRIEALLGRGGMGAVYEATQLVSGERVAMKIVRRTSGDTLTRRFEREAKAMSLLGHPGIVEVLDFGPVDDGGLFLVMELVRGASLADVVEDSRLPPARVLAVARQVLQALAHAHRAGVIHRDLKPENIMLVPDEAEAGGYKVKLLDFGIAKVVGEAAAEIGGETLTQAGITFGTPDYMSPEQALGQPVDARSDLYSLGVILFELLAGRKPFQGDPMSVVRMHVTAPPPALLWAAGDRLPPEVGILVDRALMKERAQRFAGAEEMLAALDRAAASLAPRPIAAPARPATPTPPGASGPVRARPWEQPLVGELDPRVVRIALLCAVGLLFVVVLVAVLATSS